MRVLILTPTALPSLTGNAITSERWRYALEKQGITVKVTAVQNLDRNALPAEISLFQPDIIHGHHAFKTGRLLVKNNGSSFFSDIPFVISCAGTDINQDLATNEKKDTVIEVCRNARAIITQSEDISFKLKKSLNGFQNDIIYVPKSFMWLGDNAFDLRKVAGCKDRDILFFLPAGIRPVKGNIECLEAFMEINRINPSIKIIFAGPTLEHDYTLRFQYMVERCSDFAKWIPAIPPRAMRSAYRGADVVLNTSFSEGFSNVLLEAMASGRPIIASDINSNRMAITGNNGDSPGGLLFDPDDHKSLTDKILKLADDSNLRFSMGQAGLARAERWPGPESESGKLIEVYEHVLAQTRS